jgi:hypothetical protein
MHIHSVTVYCIIWTHQPNINGHFIDAHIIILYSTTILFGLFFPKIVCLGHQCDVMLDCSVRTPSHSYSIDSV